MKESTQSWDNGLQLLLVMIVGFNLIPHTLDIPPWITAASVICLVWKTLSLTRGIVRPRQWVLNSLTVVGTVAVFAQYRTLLGQEAASALLVLLASLKVMETNRYRDAMLVTFTSYFLLMAHLLNSQSLLSTLFMGLDVLLITALMFHLHKHGRDRRTSPRSFRPAIRMLTLALPVWVFLFLAFPRFTTGFWRLTSPPQVSVGFTEDLNPGSVEQLVESDEPAFRVNLEQGLMLSPEVMYWRGAVLTHSEGLKWTKPGRDLPLESLVAPDSDAKPVYRYEVFLEPLFRRWIFALDYPRDVSASDPFFASSLRRVPGFVYEIRRDLSARAAYSGFSTTKAPLQRLTETERALYLQLPESISPRVRELAGQLKKGTTAADQASRNVLRWFDHQGFRYSRQPGALPVTRDQVDAFLFETKRGFCEHYAAAYANLMRAMGHPARVAVGFQGGRYNELGQYYIIRNMDAHAWAEIWVPEAKDSERGRWQRVDPTSLIAPLRLQLGGDFYRLDSNTLAAGLSTEELQRNLQSGFFGLRKFQLQAALAWDAAQMRWNGFLLRYDFDYQQSLLDSLGFKNASRWIFFVWVSAGVVIFVIALHITLRRRARNEDPLLVSWREFCLTLDKAGLGRHPTEGPRAYAERVGRMRPERAKEIDLIAQNYIELRYGPEFKDGSSERAAKLRAFRQSVRRFSIKSNSRPAES